MTNHLHRERAERPKESPTVAPKNKTAAPKASLYEEITARIIADLEAGTFPWAQPWGVSPGNAALGLPRNAATGKSYSGINVLILWSRLFDRGFTSQSWLTFHQAFSLGCQIASKCDPLFAAKNDPFDGAETGGADHGENIGLGRRTRRTNESGSGGTSKTRCQDPVIGERSHDAALTVAGTGFSRALEFPLA